MASGLGTPGRHAGGRFTVSVDAAAAGKQVTVLACDGQHPLPTEAEQAKAAWMASGGEVHSADQPCPEDVEVIIDALLGIGLKAAPRDPYRALIIAANQHPTPVFALDIPSGLDADSGATPGETGSANR